jgi:hypothetical protein
VTTHNQARAIVLEAFQATWESVPGSPETPYAFDNQKMPTHEEWAYLTVRADLSRQATLGAAPNRRFRRSGVAEVWINVESDTAMARSDELSEIVRSIYEGRTLGGAVHFLATTIAPIGNVGRWHRTLVTTPFWYEEHK